MNSHTSLLQIIPRAPADCGGVGDYARQLARRLQELHGINSIFLSAARATEARTADGFEVLSPLRSVVKDLPAANALLLHYVNYGYNRRGIPHWLPSVLRRLENAHDAKLVTIFHEIYAAGSWRQSAFWLRPLQKQIARSLAHLSTTSVVSNETQRAQLERLAPETQIVLQPVMSNFGEPALTRVELANRDPRRWLICGGNELLERSLRSLIEIVPLIPASYSPRELLVIGGIDNLQIRAMLDQLTAMQTSYHPRVESSAADKLVSSCAFAWIDYFHQPNVSMATILKSTVFAAICAHGVIPVFPHDGSPVSLGTDRLPGPFFVAQSGRNLPTEAERPGIAYSLHEWYQRNSSSEHLAHTVATAIGLAA